LRLLAFEMGMSGVFGWIAVISNFRTELQNEKRMKNFAIFVKWKKEK